MNPRKRIAGQLKERILILDGAMGTELQKRGLPPGVCPEAWSLQNPVAVAAIHADYREAGADIVYTATFGANRIKLGRFGISDALDLNRSLARIARGAVGPGGLVFGDIGPTGHFVEPFGELPFEEVVSVFKEQARGLLEGGVDGFVIETMMDIQEARAALIAVRELCDLFTIVSMTYEKHGRTLNGTDPVAALITLQGLGADAVGCNCSAGPEGMLAMVAAMKPYATVPLVAKPNAGLPQLVGDHTVFDMDTAAFAGFGGRFAAAGVNLMGGCCGTTPETIAALKQALSVERPAAPVRQAIAAVSSARSALTLGAGDPLCLVGGRIDAARDESLRAAVQAGEMGAVRQLAREQEKEGVPLVRIAMGVPGLDEGAVLRKIIGQLGPTTRLGCLVDCGRDAALQDLLRFYPGRLLLRTEGGPPAQAAMLEAAARYGALPILACRPEEGFEAGRRAIRVALKEARRQGLAPEEIGIDPTPAGALPPPEALRTAYELVLWCAERVGCPTLIDLTDIGRGLPERQWLQLAVLAAAQAAGVSLVVADPAAGGVMHLRAAGTLLAGKDAAAAAWRARFV
jgi:5-methyltetrahydrofolate--homocysteine methyltransferase